MSLGQIEFFFEDIPDFDIRRYKFDIYIKELIKKETKKSGNISIIFCSDSYLLDINKQYLNHNYLTDIITFDYVENDLISGDLFISIDRIKENAKLFDNEFINELYRVIFHGILHLIGYKDKNEEDKKIMRKREDYYLGWVNNIEE